MLQVLEAPDARVVTIIVLAIHAVTFAVLWQSSGSSPPRRSRARTAGFSALHPKTDETRKEAKPTAAGLTLLSLIQDWTWIHRRVERVELLDAESVRRWISIDFTRPSTAARVLPCAPLGFARKRALRGFDLRGENGQVVPLLAFDEAALLAAQALTRLAGLKLGSCPRAFADAFARLASGTPDRARSEIESWRADARNVHADWHHEWSRLLSDKSFLELAELLERDSLLLAAVAPDETRRRVIKLAYEEAPRKPPHGDRPDREPADGEPQDREPPDRWRLRLHERLLVSLGWRHANFDIQVFGARLAGSYHLEVLAPPDLELDLAVLYRLQRGKPVEPALGWDRNPRRVHLAALALNPPGDPSGEDRDDEAALHGAPQQDEAIPDAARLFIRPERAGFGFQRASLALTVFVELVLVFGRLRLDEVSSQVEAMTTLLVVIPGIVTVVLIRPGEHELAPFMFSGLRAAVLLSALAAGLGAATLIGDFCDGDRGALWYVALGLGTLAFAAALFSNFLPRRLRPPQSASISW